MVRPRDTWYVPKAINDIDRILDALEVVKEMDGMLWSKKSNNQKKLMDKIKSIEDYGGTPSAMAGRNWMATFQFFGFIYPRISEDGKKYIKITQIGKIANEFNRLELIRMQLLKLQFPNPYQSKYMSNDIQMFPYWTILKLTQELEYITIPEIAYFILWIKNHSEIPNAVKKIKSFRRTGKLPKNIQKLKKNQEDLLIDYASRVRLYFCYTNLLDYKEDKIILNTLNMALIDNILNNKPDVNKNFIDKSNWNEWFEHYGRGKKKHRTITGKLTKYQYKAKKLIRHVYLISNKSKSNRIALKKLSLESKINMENIDKILHDPNLIEKFPELKNFEIKNKFLYMKADEKPKIKGEYSDKVLAYIEVLESAEDSDNWLEFEDNVKEIFDVLQFETEQLGGRASGERDVPDTIVKSIPSAKLKEKPWAILIDTKSRKKSFGLGTNSRRAMIEYANKFIEDKKYRSYYLEGVLFVSSNFSGDVKSKCEKLRSELKNKFSAMDITCACITAKSLLYILDIFLNEPGKINHEKIKQLIKMNTLITNLIIDEIKEK